MKKTFFPPNYNKTVVPIPSMRNFVLDTCYRGHKKNIVYSIFSVDVTNVRNFLKSYKEKNNLSISFSSYILKEFTEVIKLFPIFNSYRKGKKKLVVFDDVDCSVMIESEIDGILQPIHYIIRDANKKTLQEIQKEIRYAQKQRFEDYVPKLDRFFFSKVPRLLRNWVWHRSNKEPDLFKHYSGTVGLTSVGMFGTGFISVVPLTPMTSTLAIGTIEKKLQFNASHDVVEHEFLYLTLSVDHKIIDSAPLMRFIAELKKKIENKDALTAFASSI